MKLDPPAPLTVLLQTAEAWAMTGLLARLHAAGFTDVREPHLILLGNLDCGTTHAAAVAQRMRVSRQAIHRTVREMQAMGYLRLEEDPERGNQKLVVMTEAGGRLALAGRAALAEMESLLAQRIGEDSADALRAALEEGWGDPGCSGRD